MAEKKNSSPKNSSLFTSAVSTAAEVMETVVLFFREIKKNLQSQVDWLLRRAEYIFVVYLWVSTGMLFLILGVFYLLIDYGHFSRGIVFSIGGCLVLLISIIFLQAAKIKKK